MDLKRPNSQHAEKNFSTKYQRGGAKSRIATQAVSSDHRFTKAGGATPASIRRSENSSKEEAINWVKTSEAAAALGWSAKYLKRQREEKGGFLSPGIHFLYGPTLRSSIVWNVDLIRGAFHRRGLAARQEVSA